MARLVQVDAPGRSWTGERVLVRADLNAPLDDGPGGRRVTDDARIGGSVPTLRYLLDRGAAVAVCSHLGRPEGERVDALSLAPCAARLAELLGQPVEVLPDCMGSEVEARVRALTPGEIVMLENLRFHPGEEANDAAFAERLAAGFTAYVNDAFGVAHRAHASTAAVTRRLDSSAGLLLAREVEVLAGLLDHPAAPFVSVLGGSKVSDKLPLIENLIIRSDRILIGGAMCFTFLAAAGDSVGTSLHEGPDAQALTLRLLERAHTLNCTLQLPTDVLVADRFSADANLQVVPSDAIPDGWMGVDIGPRTAAAYREVIETAGTVLWNGPMGAFEIPPFADGTRVVAEAMAACSGVTVAGGGDSGAALADMGLADDLTWVSTGGGAALQMLEGRTLPGVAALPTA
ncbi:MAG: phosphoglycerate kinase [Thermoleophilia bacterium]|nr:phosphoglycerate kinase [Thermoleophilia bacterium]